MLHVVAEHGFEVLQNSKTNLLYTGELYLVFVSNSVGH